MILFPILLAFFTGLVILRLSNQHKYLNVFEQLALGFVTALSLFIFELFIGGIVFDKLSLVGPIATFIICLGLLIYKDNKHKGFVKEIIQHIKFDFINIKTQFKVLKSWEKYVIIGILIYVLFKIFMVFSINTHMPTFDEDAVAGRDLKTKIFSENKSLVFDKSSPEYFGTDYGRYPFAGVIDTYFLLPYGEYVNGLGNIISPLMYLFSIILLFGIFFRKTDLFVAIVSGYIFTSLPFVFIHGFGSYRNFPSGVILFLFIFYVSDRIFNLEKNIDNKKVILPIILVGFLSSIIRNESAMLSAISLIVVIGIYCIMENFKCKETINKLRILCPVILGYITNKIIYSFYPSGTILNTGGGEISSNLFGSFFSNIGQAGVFPAPFQQMFFHPDYILSFSLLIICLVLFYYNYKKNKTIYIMLSVTIFLLLTFMFTLYANVKSLGLISHFAFIRYPVSIVLFIVYIVVYGIYIHKKNNESGL